MPHIDPERLALFAIGEPVASRLRSPRTWAIAPSASTTWRRCVTPPSRVARASTSANWRLRPRSSGHASSTSWRSGPSAAGARGVRPSPATPAVVDAPRRRVMTRIWALAASLVLVAGVGLGVWAVTQRAAQTEVAEATLAPFPDHPSAEGSAVVEEGPDGTLAVRVELSADAAPDTFREVWLITADASALVSLGVLDGTAADLRDPGGRRPEGLRARRRVAGACGRRPEPLGGLDRPR